MAEIKRTINVDPELYDIIMDRGESIMDEIKILIEDMLSNASSKDGVKRTLDGINDAIHTASY